MSPVPSQHWTIGHLRQHVQYAVDLEFWTIPFYMSAMYSIIDRTSDAYQLIQSIVNQEMLHLQLAANVGNAYGYSPTFHAPVYDGTIPHIDFNLDHPNPVALFSPYSAEIGPLDHARINAMCLVEYPDWVGQDVVNLNDNVREYPNIGEFYRALAYGAHQLMEHIQGGVRQVDWFSAYYRNIPSFVVSDIGCNGFHQVDLLIQTITEQGEGVSRADPNIASAFQNTSTDGTPQLSHFEKFIKIRESQAMPLTYPVKPVSQYTEQDLKLLAILRDHFKQLRAALTQLFSGNNPPDFIASMITVGADIQNCWKNGVTPRFD